MARNEHKKVLEQLSEAYQNVIKEEHDEYNPGYGKVPDRDYREVNKKLISTLRHLADSAEFGDHESQPKALQIFDSLKEDWTYLSGINRDAIDPRDHYDLDQSELDSYQ